PWGMGLLDLPPEIRLQIYDYLPDFSPGRNETVGPNVRLTPALCRAGSRVLREEALPLYAKTSSFIIQTDDNFNRVDAWLQALAAGDALSKVQSLQLSRHWKIKQPSRWQGHVGFYVRVHLHDKTWQCTAGTYPFANDTRGMRLESVELLCSIVRQRLGQLGGLSRSDVEFIVEAMDIVASHPVSTFDSEQSEDGRRRRRDMYTTMERHLMALCSQSSNGRALGKESLHSP
ncbi:hypothetical protein LTR37_019958, partial [Vermiconidia calcicola]